MTTFLDLLIVVALVMVAASLVAVALMFLVKNRIVKRICLYLAAALGIYLSYVGLYIFWPMYTGQAVLALLTGLASIGAIVLERLSKDSSKRLLTAEVMVSAALIIGMLNVFV